jgi:hypothetical protein
MPRTATGRWTRAGIALALADFVWATILAVANGNPPLGPWNAVARTAFGPDALESGPVAIAVGLCVHIGVAFGWSGLYVLIESRWSALRRLVSTPAGLLAAAAVVGPLVWILMSSVVIPLRTGRALTITSRWFIQLAGHVLFVGLPIVWGARRQPGAMSG